MGNLTSICCSNLPKQEKLTLHCKSIMSDLLWGHPLVTGPDYSRSRAGCRGDLVQVRNVAPRTPPKAPSGPEPAAAAGRSACWCSRTGRPCDLRKCVWYSAPHTLSLLLLTEPARTTWTGYPRPGILGWLQVALREKNKGTSWNVVCFRHWFNDATCIVLLIS